MRHASPPYFVVISDSGKEYASQETVSWYRHRCRGFELNGERRRVLSTRNDGRVRTTSPQGAVTTSRNGQPNRQPDEIVGARLEAAQKAALLDHRAVLQLRLHPIRRVGGVHRLQVRMVDEDMLDQPCGEKTGKIDREFGFLVRMLVNDEQRDRATRVAKHPATSI